MKTRIATFAVVAFFAFATTPRANADMVQYSDNIPFIQPGTSVSVSLPKFDPSMGTLLNVAFDLEGIGVLDYEVIEDFDDDGGDVEGSMFGSFETTLGGEVFGNIFDLFGFDFHNGPGVYSMSLEGNAGEFIGNPDDVSLFVAASANEMFSTEVIMDGVDAFGLDGDDVIGNDGLFEDGMITVFYQFNPIPEPNSLLVLGLFSIGLARTRRRVN